jgi:outer membrane protein assembly factor BamB
MRKVTVFIVFAFLVGCCFVSGVSNQIEQVPVDTNKSETPNESPTNTGLMDSAWPMHKNDARRTGCSPIHSNGNLGGERWKYLFEGIEEHTAVIDSNGTLYISMYIDLHGELHAVYPNGTIKWKSDLDYEGYVPAIGPDGTIYVGTRSAFYAFYQNGTIKWILNKEKKFNGEPVISDNGTIYVGTDDGFLYAISPNGSIQWEYYVGNYPIDPAIDNQGDIYFTTYYQKNLYCLNPNGTLKWKMQQYNFQRGPVIGNDGTIYVVPIHWLVAVNPNGTEKWKIDFSDWEGFPSLAPDGTIILSGQNSGYITALNPADGNILWKYQISTSVNPIDATEAVIGGDGTIYFAYNYDDKVGYLCALTPAGTLKWETHLTSDIQPNDGFTIISDPSIGMDGTIYITTWLTREGSNFTSFGYLYAIGKKNPSPAPTAPTVTGTLKGRMKTPQEYTFQATSPTGGDVYYFIDWGDYEYEKWIGPYPSGTPVKINHTWSERGTYTIQAKAKSIDNLCGPWGTLSVEMPTSYNQPLLKFLELLFQRLPNAFPILRYLLDQ